MKRLFILIGIFLLSCSHEKTPNENYSNVINELLKNELKEVDLVLLETRPVQRGDTLDGSPKIGYTYLNFYAKKNLINQEDIEFIYLQIDSLYTIVLDSTKIDTKTIHKTKLNKLFESMGMDSTLNFLREKRNIRGIATFSTPLFSKDKKRIIFWVDVWRGPLDGGGYVFIVSKEKGGWKIIERGITYKS